MDPGSGQLPAIVAVSLASAVEVVEASTIVLAMGLTRGWRSTIAGVIAAVVVLAVVTYATGNALVRSFPEATLHLVIGSLMLLFGLQWLRKAILRSAGLLATHDEETSYRAHVAEAFTVERRFSPSLDSFAFVVAFKAVLLEGLEVVFIVVSVGLTAGDIAAAAMGATISSAIVLMVAVIAHRPLSRIPQNTVKFAVGILLATFGTIWAVEGLGAVDGGRAAIQWPGGGMALVVVLLTWLVVARGLVAFLRRRAGGTAQVNGSS